LLDAPAERLYLGSWFLIPLRVAARFARNRSVLFMPLRVAAARNRSANTQRVPACTLLRAGAMPCTRNGCWWIANVCWSCLGCER
jgi:hypothetical protein